MPKAKEDPHVLRRKEKVRAAVDLRDVPEGTTGRVVVTTGLDWIRYFVAFDNGVEMGSVHRDKLVRAKEWKQYLKDREAAALRADEVGTDIEPVADASAGGEAAAGGGAVVNGVEVPALLLERTKAALERFGVTR